MAKNTKKFDNTGLKKLFGDDFQKALKDIDSFKTRQDQDIKKVNVNDIKLNPYQPRKIFDNQEIENLANSIKENGLISPVALVKDVSGFILISGERRLRAYKLLKLNEIEAIVLEVPNSKLEELALIENIQREDLNGIEEALALQSLMLKHNLTHDKLSDKISKSRSYVTNALRLLKLPKVVQKMILEEKLSVGHGKLLLSLDSETKMIDIAYEVVKSKLSVQSLEKLLKRRQFTSKIPRGEKSKDILYAEKLIREKLNTKVNIKTKKIIISYKGVKDLNRIIEEIGALEK